MNKRRRFKAKARRLAALRLARWQRSYNPFWSGSDTRGPHLILEADVLNLRRLMSSGPPRLEMP